MTHFEIVTAAGVTCRIFDTAEAARRYVMAHKLDLPGLAIEQVETITVRTAVYTPRKARAA